MDNLHNQSDFYIHIDLYPEDIKDKFVREGLHKFNIKHVGKDNHYSVFAFNSSDEIIGGILVYAKINSIFIETLWVKDSERGKGIGAKLLQAAETEAIHRKIPNSTLDTVSLQAKGFYIKNSYHQIGIVKNYIEGHDRLFFRKELMQ